jgi:hypothetical protein
MKIICFWICLITVALFDFSLLAQERVLNDIKNIPRLDSFESGPRNVVGEYHGRGVIDALDNNDIVINDSIFTLSERIKIMQVDGSSFSGKLTPGIMVYYYLDGPKRIDRIFIDQ